MGPEPPTKRRAGATDSWVDRSTTSALQVVDRTMYGSKSAIQTDIRVDEQRLVLIRLLLTD
jgi:hypothetical protein